MTPFFNIFPTSRPPHGFRDPAQLLGWLHGPGGDPESRNAVLTQLLHASHVATPGNDLAVELLILALWPGLCVVRQRLRPFAKTGTLEADLIGQIAIGIRTSQPGRVERVAATLLRNAERDLRRAWRRDAEVCRLNLEGDADLPWQGEVPADAPMTIMSLAQSALGDDGVLLTAVHIAGFSQKEAGALVGLGHEAARKRCQRAMARLREHSDA